MRSTFSSSLKVIAILDNKSKCSPSLPAIPTTTLATSSPHCTPSGICKSVNPDCSTAF